MFQVRKAGDGSRRALSIQRRQGRTVLKASPFLGEGHRKVKARLAARGIRVGKNRVLRLMPSDVLCVPGDDGRGGPGEHRGCCPRVLQEMGQLTKPARSVKPPAPGR